MGSWDRFLSLSGRDRWLLMQGMVLLPVTSVALRLMGFRRWQSVLTRMTPAEGTRARDLPEASIELAQCITRMLQAASHRGLWRVNCLEHSLSLWWMLRRRGVPADLRIGVHKLASGLEAHAWVELSGRILNDSEDVHRHYTPFDGDIGPVQMEPR